MPRSRGGQRSLGALDDLFIECRERAADAAHFGHDHSRVYLCGAVRIVIFWRGGLRPALAHSLKADPSSIFAAASDVSFAGSMMDWRRITGAALCAARLACGMNSSFIG